MNNTGIGLEAEGFVEKVLTKNPSFTKPNGVEEGSCQVNSALGRGFLEAVF